MNTPFVSIIIPVFNASKTIARTIEACLSQTYPQEKLEVIVVDDGSTDRTREIVTHYPVVLVSQRNSGPAAARNRGWRASKGEMICFTDADCIPEKEWISKLVKKYTSQEIGGVGGSYGIVNCESFLASSIHEEIVERHLKMPSSVDYLGSFNLSYRREVLEETGGFNETYREASGEDNDLSYRVKKAGYTLLFDPTIVVAHHHPERLFRYLRQQFKHGYWRVLLYLQHPTMIKGDGYSGVGDLAQPPL
ncbi:MAG: glycosyltransferase, partial [Candidatus Tectomicrobia bacterium]|nr:glycosyltransferase [Candidatus Tectomicrobia bacterium]